MPLERSEGLWRLRMGSIAALPQPSSAPTAGHRDVLRRGPFGGRDERCAGQRSHTTLGVRSAPRVDPPPAASTSAAERHGASGLRSACRSCFR